MNRLFIILIILLGSIQLSAQDTLCLKGSEKILSEDLLSENVENISLIELNYFFNGYLIISFDSNSKLISPEMFKTSVFWIDSLSKLEDISSRYYYRASYTLLFSLLYPLESERLNNKFDKLSYFVEFYNVFNIVNQDSINIYLFKEALNTDLIIRNNDNCWNKKGIKYFIFKSKFNTTILQFDYKGGYSKKLFIPISYLKEFRPISEEEALGASLEKSSLIIIQE